MRANADRNIKKDGVKKNNTKKNETKKEKEQIAACPDPIIDSSNPPIDIAHLGENPCHKGGSATSDESNIA